MMMPLVHEQDLCVFSTSHTRHHCKLLSQTLEFVAISSRRTPWHVTLLSLPPPARSLFKRPKARMQRAKLDAVVIAEWAVVQWAVDGVVVWLK